MATTSSAPTAPPAGLTPHQRFLLDLNGYVVLRGVFSPKEVADANAVIDAHLDDAKPRDSPALRNAASGGSFSGPGPRTDIGGILWWKDGHLFRRVLAHPVLAPVLNEVLDAGYRLDHQPQLILQDTGGEGFSLHGGPLSGTHTSPKHVPELQYKWVSPGRPWTSLLAVSVVLSRHGPSDGGFCVVRGSHKLNLPLDRSIASGRAPELGFDEHIHQPVTEPGDVILFSEATIHGALPWRGTHQRRLALYRFCPAVYGYGRGHYEWTDSQKALLSPAQRAVCEPPYAVRLERPTLPSTDCSEPTVEPRADEKKAFDKALFGTAYF